MLRNKEEKMQTVEAPRKNRKDKTFRTMAGMMALCAVLSGSFGYLGGSLSAGGEESNVAVSAPQQLPSDDLAAVSTAASSSSGSMTVAEIAAACADSVVEIVTESVSTNQFLQQYVTEGAGSGVIISEDGYIITNNHVIEDASRITVTTRSGEEYEATLIGTDSQTDVAVIKIEAEGLNAATFGDSDSLVVGQTAVAIGNPLGELGGTVSDGIISALSREITIEDETMTLLQTNAAINPGNSGGGLFDDQGHLIGIVNAKSSGTGIEGIGFAIPINTAKAIAMDLIENGVVTGRIEMGLGLVVVNDYQTAMQYGVSRAGVYVASVTGTAAEAAGFQQGDLITAVDGTEVSSVSEIKAILREHNVGDQITVSVIRGNRTGDLTLTLQQAAGTASVA